MTNLLPQKVYANCRAVLLRCNEFDSDQYLRSVFVVQELYSFRDDLPEASSRRRRVEGCIEFLAPLKLEDGRSALAFFIQFLGEMYDVEDMLHHELLASAKEVQENTLSMDTSNLGIDGLLSNQDKQQSEILGLQELLDVHRKTLFHYLKQQAMQGTAFVPPGVDHGIQEARKHIRHIKDSLRKRGIIVNDFPYDEGSLG